MSHQAPRAAPTNGRARLKSALGFRPTRAQIVAAVLLGLLGFAAAVQIRATQESELDSLRQTDLVRILDDVSERTARLQAEARELEQARDEVSGGGSGAAALEQAREQSRVLGILAGTEPATGSGLTLTIWDLEGENAAVVLLDALQELRDAGAEAIEIATVDGPAVRVVASTYVVDVADGVEADGTTLVPPYQFTAIGDPSTLATALDIPGGVLDRVDQEGAVAVVEELPVVEIRSLRAAPSPRYARPAPDANSADGTGQEGDR
jgi:uncharacterized protein YlxW (UPF0749 family)